jgi:hypothetical protein
MPMTKETRTLTDADISSRPSLTRRTLLGSLGLGVGAAAAAAAIGRPALAQAPKRRDPCRDRDHYPSDSDGCAPPSPTS